MVEDLLRARRIGVSTQEGGRKPSVLRSIQPGTFPTDPGVEVPPEAFARVPGVWPKPSPTGTIDRTGRGERRSPTDR